jgi:hypothetical protein
VLGPDRVVRGGGLGSECEDGLEASSRASTRELADVFVGRFGTAANGTDERLHDALEDTFTAQAVVGGEVDRAVQLKDHSATVGWA